MLKLSGYKRNLWFTRRWLVAKIAEEVSIGFSYFVCKTLLIWPWTYALESQDRMYSAQRQIQFQVKLVLGEQQEKLTKFQSPGISICVPTIQAARDAVENASSVDWAGRTPGQGQCGEREVMFKIFGADTPPSPVLS